MYVYILDEKSNALASMKLESNPFTVGQTFHLEIKNNSKKDWIDVEDKDEYYKIKKIESALQIHYNMNAKLPHQDLTFFVTVKKIKKPV